MHKPRKRLTLPRSAELFTDLPQNQVSEMLGAAEVKKIGPQQNIFREGSPPTHLFLLVSGRVKFYRLTHDGNEVLLADLAPGDAFGLGTLLARPMPCIGTAQTTRDSQLLVWKQA